MGEATAPPVAKLIGDDAKEVVKAIIQATATGDLPIPEWLMPAPRDSKLEKLAQRAEKAVLKAVAAGKLAIDDACQLLRCTSEIRNNPLYRLPDIQRRAVIVHIGMIVGEPMDDMFAKLELDDESWHVANETVSRETWEQIDAYYGFVVPAAPQSSQRSAKK